MQRPETFATFTKFISDSDSINKSYPKRKRTNFYIGSYQTITTPWKRFGNHLASLNLTEVISLGTPDPQTTPSPTGPVGPEADPPFLRNSHYLGWNGPKHGAAGNIVLLDIDKIPESIQEEVKTLEFTDPQGALEVILDRILQDLPELDQLLSITGDGIWGYPSASSYIKEEKGDTDTPTYITGLKGIHFYILLPWPHDPDDFRKYLHAKLATQEKNPGSASTTAAAAAYSDASYIYEGKNCHLELRTYVDQKAIGKERLDFIAGTKTEAPYTQERPQPYFFEFEPLTEQERKAAATSLPDFRSLNVKLTPKLNEAKRTRIQAYSQDPGFQARRLELAEERSKNSTTKAGPKAHLRSIQQLQNGIITGSTLLYFDQQKATPIPAYHLLLDPESYNTMTLADPRDEQLRNNKAIFYASCPHKFIDDFAHQSQGMTGAHTQLVAGAPVIYGFKGGDMVMQIKMDLESINAMMDGKSAEQMVQEYGADWYKLLAETNGLSPAEIEEILQDIKHRWGQAKAYTQKLVSASYKEASKKYSNQAIADAIAEFDKEYKLLKQGSNIVAVWEESSPIFLGTTVTATLGKQAFCDFFRKTIYDVDEKGRQKAYNIAELWWNRDHPLKYSGVTFDPTTREDTVVLPRPNSAGEEYFLNLYHGHSVEALAPGDRPCQGNCNQKSCLKWFMEEGIPQIDAAKRDKEDPAAPDASWRTWGCPHEEDPAKAKSSCIWYFRSLYENICNHNKKLFAWALDWIADMFQNPASKPKTAFIMQGGQGVGKGLVVAPIGRIYSRHYYHAQSRREITGRFNLHLQNLIVLFGDESSWGGDRSEGGTWKGFISEEIKGYEGKGIDINHSRNYARLFVASNDTWAIPAEGDDRRHFVTTASKKYQNKVDEKIQDGIFSGYWAKVANICDGSLLWELLHREITNNINVAPITQGLVLQKLQSMTLTDQFIGWMLEHAPGMFDQAIPNSEFYDILDRQSNLAFNREFVKQKGFVQGLASALTPECGERVSNIGPNRTRGMFLYREKVEEWYNSKFVFEEDEDEVD